MHSVRYFVFQQRNGIKANFSTIQAWVLTSLSNLNMESGRGQGRVLVSSPNSSPMNIGLCSGVATTSSTGIQAGEPESLVKTKKKRPKHSKPTSSSPTGIQAGETESLVKTMKKRSTPRHQTATKELACENTSQMKLDGMLPNQIEEKALADTIENLKSASLLESRKPKKVWKGKKSSGDKEKKDSRASNFEEQVLNSAKTATELACENTSQMKLNGMQPNPIEEKALADTIENLKSASLLETRKAKKKVWKRKKSSGDKEKKDLTASKSDILPFEEFREQLLKSAKKKKPSSSKKKLEKDVFEDYLSPAEVEEGLETETMIPVGPIRRSEKVTMSETDSSLSETESLSVMTETLNPWTGEYAWVKQDEQYDFHQEIARSAFADMLHDSERNEKYYEAIKAAIDQKHREGRMAHVLDIGTGTGLLAMMAARCGADTIHACEAFSPISKCAVKVIQENGLADKIKVIHKRSTAMVVGEGGLPQPANILVTEVFDTELIGEGAIETFNHALEHLMEKDSLVVPSSGTVYAQVVESEWMQRWNKLTPWGDVAPSQDIQRCPGAAAVHDLQLSQLRQEDFRAITSPEPVFRFDFTGRTRIPEDDSSTVSTKAAVSGTAQMVFMWWSLDMDLQGKIVLSCAPWWAHPSQPPGPEAIPWRDHWMQAVYYLPSSVPVQKGETLKLLSNHDEYSLWFNLCTSEGFSSSPKDSLALDFPQECSLSPDKKQTARPVCNCMLHVTCSRTRIGMLNDPTRRAKYLEALQRLVTPQSVVLSYGDTSLLGLLAATLGASKVYHIEDNTLSREVIKGLIKANNLESKVTLLNSESLSEKIKSSVNLVVGEPYFMTALCPWHMMRWWMLRWQYPDAVGMPVSASLHIMPMQFDHLHKIRAPLGNISGFKMTAFDELVQSSSLISDSKVEVHPLWEYPGICLGYPKEIESFDRVQNFYSAGNMPVNASGTWNGMVLWMDIYLDADTKVSTGPVEPPVPGSPVRWDPYTRQAVHFVLPEVTVTAKNFLQYKAVFNGITNTDIEFKFNLQSEHFVLPP